jgi:hypothetical protein
MNLNQENDYIPSLKLLPFGGFEVALLLQKLHSGAPLTNDGTHETLDFQPKARAVSSGWLSSKIMAG